MEIRENVFDGKELQRWAFISGLFEKEKDLIGRFLHKEKSTIEAGTGNGRILIEMKKLGFSSLHGFDLSSRMIDMAKSRQEGEGITFEGQDATCLPYADCTYDQGIYLQQVICFIDSKADRFKAFQESYRILKKPGIAIFSFLNFDGRASKYHYLLLIFYLSILRRITSSKRSIQSMPWLQHNKRLNLMALIDKGPYNYWYKTDEILKILEEIGFKIMSLETELGKPDGANMTSTRQPVRSQGLYVVCEK